MTHLRALAQRVEVNEGEVRLMGSKFDLRRTLAAAGGAGTSAGAVPSFVPNGGERGIRTLDRVAPIQHFQCCAFDRSAISPGTTRWVFHPCRCGEGHYKRWQGSTASRTGAGFQVARQQQAAANLDGQRFYPDTYSKPCPDPLPVPAGAQPLPPPVFRPVLWPDVLVPCPGALAPSPGAPAPGALRYGAIPPPVPPG